MRSFSSGQQRVLLFFTVFLGVALSLRFLYHPSPLPSEAREPEVVIEILGEVRHPGIHRFRHAPSLRDLLEKAGGTGQDLPYDFDHAGAVFETGTCVKITRETSRLIKVHAAPMEARKRLLFSIPLNLNQAGVEDLCLLPGIGEALAMEMVTYRNQRGGFLSPEELKKVKGLSEKKCLSLKPYVTAGPPESPPDDDQEE